MQVHATLLAMQKVGRIPFHQLNIMWINDMIGLTTDKLMGSCPLTPRLCESQYRPPSLWPSWRSTDPRPSHMPYAHKHTHTHTHTRAHIHTHTHTSTWLPMSVQSNKKKSHNNKKHVYLAIICPHSQCVCVCVFVFIGFWMCAQILYPFICWCYQPADFNDLCVGACVCICAWEGGGS